LANPFGACYAFFDSNFKDDWKQKLNFQTAAALQSPATPHSYDSAAAFAYCERLARAHYENFPVGSLLAPQARRKHFYSIYAFARTADDFADEGYDDAALTEAKRLAALDDWERQLAECYRGRTSHPIFAALAETAQALQLPEQLFRELLAAFKQDVVKRRYADYDEVLAYCARSANPVGRLILRLFDYRDAELDKLSDCVCTALQLTNFWQDVALDIEKDRVYLPADELARFAVSIEDLRARRCTEQYRRLLEFQVERTRALFEHGRSLPDRVGGRLALELRFTWHGGMRILELIERRRYDTLSVRPKLTGVDKLVMLGRALFRR
jgi:phytoene synthase